VAPFLAAKSNNKPRTRAPDNLGTGTIQESTLSGNSAGSAGGGIVNSSFGALAVKDSTALHNVAPPGADLYDPGALTLDDSAVGVIGP